MKNVSKIILSTVLVVSTFTACKKEDTGSNNGGGNQINVTQVQNALVVEPTATWCGPCGTYGRPATELAIEGNNKAVAIYAHLKAPSSDYPSQLGQDLAVIYGAANATGSSYSIPKIAVGNNITGAYTDLNYTANILKGWINTITAKTSNVNTKIEASVSGNTLNVKTNTKFFADGQDSFTYKVAIYVTEDNIAGRQFMSSGSYQNITHNHVSRLCLSSNVAGDDLMAGKPTSGTVISKEFSGSIDAAWKKENLTVIAVIWRQKGNSLVFENVDKIDL